MSFATDKDIAAQLDYYQNLTKAQFLASHPRIRSISDQNFHSTKQQGIGITLNILSARGFKLHLEGGRVIIDDFPSPPTLPPAKPVVPTPIQPIDDIILTGEIYKDGRIVSSGAIKKSDLDKLLALPGYSSVETPTPRPPEDTSGADPYAGGYDPATGVGLQIG